MEELLRRLLNSLDQIAIHHEEIYDTVCRELMGLAIFNGYIRPQPNFQLPDDFGLAGAKANVAVGKALSQYIYQANKKASQLGINRFHDRLASFQLEDVVSDNEQNCYDDYFGYSRPDVFDELGNVI